MNDDLIARTRQLWALPLRGLEVASRIGLEAARQGQQLLGFGTDDPQPNPTPAASPPATVAPSLRRQGAELLRLSTDLTHREESHPAFAQIASQLAPDEARVLRLLALEGPCPAVDVRVASGPDKGALIAATLTTAVDRAGGRHPDRAATYVANLRRLGLVEVDDENLPPDAYGLLEADSAVQSATSGARRASIVRRRLYLTDFGAAFVDQCLRPEGGWT